MKKHAKVLVFLCVLSVMALYNLISKKDIIFIIPRTIRMSMEIFFFISLVSFILVEILIIEAGRVKHTQESDYLVVLGAGLRGKSPSIPLLQRLNASLEYVKINPNIKIVVSGGRGIDESITEAEAMKRFLIKRGVAVDQIIKEERSTSTLENLKFTAEILKELEEKENIEVTIVTNNFHMFRAKFLARRVGLKTYGYPAPLNLRLVSSCFIREYFAVINSFIFDRL
jgi:uncharacterized SAM-binding protein YcdF (DUF218 family)